jgi:hypothetical protein
MKDRQEVELIDLPSFGRSARLVSGGVPVRDAPQLPVFRNVP